MRKYSVLLLIVFLLPIIINAQNKLPNDVRWVVESSEYKILCNQIYNNAWNNLEHTLKSETEKWAIVMDLDETVLDNSKYQITLVEKGENYNPESWSKWVNLKQAGLVPGAKTFINRIRTIEKYQIIFVSNRMHSNLEPTIDNMKELGIYGPNDIFLLRTNKQDKKPVRRNEILTGTERMKRHGAFKVLAFLGDASGDFPKEDSILSFSKGMYMFPNPMYGKW